MIEIFIYTILIIYGVNKTTDHSMIFEWVRIKSSVLPDKANKVLFDCTPCMSSFYGSISFFFTDLSWYYLPVWIMSLCGAITLLNRLTK